jgi:hypothetical protein
VATNQVDFFMARVLKIHIHNPTKFFPYYKDIIEHSIPGAMFYTNNPELTNHLLELPDYFLEQYSPNLDRLNKQDEDLVLFDLEKMVIRKIREIS